MEKIKVCTSLLRQGQVVVSPVFDENGLLVMGEGTEINDKNLYLLKSIGIRSVEIEKNDSVFKWQLWQEPAERIEETKKRFAGKSDKYMDLIKNAIIERLKEQLKGTTK